MIDPKGKGELLSVGAKTYVEEQAKQYVYGYTPNVKTREMEKGIVVEADSIALLNEVLFTDYKKNQESRENDWITGTCDIFTWNHIHDVKSSWSLSTFPAFAKNGVDKSYEWQLRGYQMLWDVNSSEIDYCMVDTPAELIGYEDERLHFVSHIDPNLRVTRVPFTRTGEAEAKIKQRVSYCQAYFVEAVQDLINQHK
ncbi:MAG: hypothetical protein ACREHG_02605 [Candidatus Saccharimonadales bacterium]